MVLIGGRGSREGRGERGGLQREAELLTSKWIGRYSYRPRPSIRFASPRALGAMRRRCLYDRPSVTHQSRCAQSHTCSMKARSLLLIPSSWSNLIAYKAAVKCRQTTAAGRDDSRVGIKTQIGSARQLLPVFRNAHRHHDAPRIPVARPSHAGQTLDAGRPSPMRLTHIAPSVKLALFPVRRSSRAPLQVSQAGPDLALPAHAQSAHVIPPDNAAAVELLLQRPRGGQHAEMASFAGGGQRWAEVVGRLLPNATPEQQRLRSAMLAVDRRCFVEPSTPEALVYEVWPAVLECEGFDAVTDSISARASNMS